jgi:undecaprenyl-phosphate 4-deoxy-4-formamido-L-arabinose transferase
VSLKNEVSVVCPIYCSEATIEHLVDEICKALSTSFKFEIILIDDGSKDSSWVKILQICNSNPCVRGIRLNRNFGQHSALLAGIRSAQYEVTVTLDDDLQNPPAEIPKLINALTHDIDVVYGVGLKSEHPRWRRLTSVLIRRLFYLLLGYSEANQISSFRAFRTQLRNGFASNLGPSISIDSLLTWSTESFIHINVEHRKRLSGKSNYGMIRLIQHMINSATGYSVVPLRLATTLGSIVTILGFVMFLWVTLRPLLTGVSVPGFPLLAASLAIFSGTQLLVLGILGEYIGKMHFRVMNKPSYVIVDSSEYN